jgi:chemotaxis protein histidine kinase CheA
VYICFSTAKVLIFCSSIPLPSSEIEQLTQKEVLLIIFKDSFSTSTTVTDISGRGVGLASIIDELNKLNGTLQINNNYKQGVEFIFTVPFNI